MLHASVARRSEDLLGLAIHGPLPRVRTPIPTPIPTPTPVLGPHRGMVLLTANGVPERLLDGQPLRLVVALPERSLVIVLRESRSIP